MDGLGWGRCRVLFPPANLHAHTTTTQTKSHQPPQVYEALAAEGYRVTYVRIPLTDGACPLPRDFDTFYSAAAAAGPSDALIYTCQLGGGRTTTGMVIGSLLRMHLNGARIGGDSGLQVGGRVVVVWAWVGVAARVALRGLEHCCGSPDCPT